MNNPKPRIEITDCRMSDSLLKILTHLNFISPSVAIVSSGSNHNKTANIIQVLVNLVGIDVINTSFETYGKDNRHSRLIYQIQIKENHHLKYNGDDKKNWLSNKSVTNQFVNLSTYQFMLSWYLQHKKSLEVIVPGETGKQYLIEIKIDNGGLVYKILSGKTNKSEYYFRIVKALQRSGNLYSKHWKQIANKLSEFDDVILGLDTNIIYNCSISEELLPALSKFGYNNNVNLPNWIFLFVPSMVLHELERATNVRDGKGKMSKAARMGYRALQEILELNNNLSIPGISLTSGGEQNPIVDLNYRLQELYKILQSGKNGRVRKFNESLQRNLKSSNDDQIIRHQFSDFLKKVEFRKSCFFLTCDKSNAALAMTEGLNPIYFSPPDPNSHSPLLEESKNTNRNSYRPLNSTIGKLLYDLTVEFEEVYIPLGNKKFLEFKSDDKGEDLSIWTSRKLQVDSDNLKDFIHIYDKNFDLLKTSNFFNKVNTWVDKTKWPFVHNGIFNFNQSMFSV